MQTLFQETLLNTVISELELSEEFKAFGRQYGYQTPADILKRGRPYHLLKYPGFGYRMLFEFTSMLRKGGLGSYLN